MSSEDSIGILITGLLLFLFTGLFNYWVVGRREKYSIGHRSFWILSCGQIIGIPICIGFVFFLNKIFGDNWGFKKSVDFIFLALLYFWIFLSFKLLKLKSFNVGAYSFFLLLGQVLIGLVCGFTIFLWKSYGLEFLN